MTTTTDTPRWKAIPFMTTDTPNDACPHCGAKYFTVVEWECGTTPIIDGDTHRSPLCKEREARQKAEAELSALQRLRPTQDDVKKLESEVKRLKKVIESL